MIFDAITYSIIAIAVILAYAVVRLTRSIKSLKREGKNYEQFNM